MKSVVHLYVIYVYKYIIFFFSHKENCEYKSMYPGVSYPLVGPLPPFRWQPEDGPNE